TKKYLDVIKNLAKKAKEFTVATDYDIEGELIGLNIIRFACNQNDAYRMKFSTLTKEDLIESYKNKLDWGQANAGETRHKLDWYYGINLSRALTDAIKSAGYYKLMSIGRVQGPTLKLVVNKEKEITSFKPEDYWEIELLESIF
ncbi:MAG: DNA topoisomerase, partial [Candidatus Helarchaeota archaeon]